MNPDALLWLLCQLVERCVKAEAQARALGERVTELEALVAEHS